MLRLVHGLDARREPAARIFILAIAGLLACSGGLRLRAAEGEAHANSLSQSLPAEQDPPTSLTVTSPQPGAISAGQTIVYPIIVVPQQHFTITIDHKGIDLVARLTYGQDGETLTESRSRGADGQEKIDIVGGSPPGYHLHIEARYPRAAPGNYQVQMGEERAATKNDVLLFEAAQSYAAALTLYRQGAYNRAREYGERARQFREQ